MNLLEFNETYAAFKDMDKITLKCDHPRHHEHGLGEMVELGKQPARRNIRKNYEKEFICGKCVKKFKLTTNPSGKKWKPNDIVKVMCPDPEHTEALFREMKMSCYKGPRVEPFVQTCSTCTQRGKIISEKQKKAVSEKLTGIKRSDEFKEKLSTYMKTNPEGIARGSKNLFENHCTTGMLGKQHSEETKQKMSEAHSGKEFTEEHCQNISEGRKKMLEETGGFTREHRENISKAVVKQYQNGFDPKTFYLHGWHESPKAGKVFYRSAYEKKAFIKLDGDDLVKTYTVEQVTKEYYNPIKQITSTYIIDLHIIYTDGSQKLVEVKPAVHLELEEVITKTKAGHEKAAEMGAVFETWTEIDLFGPIYNPKNIKNFVNNLKLQEGYEMNEEEIKEGNRARAKKHYDKVIAKEKVKFFCEYCQAEHEQLKITHDKNIKKNGRFICKKESDRMPKPSKQKKENPYAAEGKKECTKCKQIKAIEEFGLDSSRSDGRASRCLTCRAAIATEKYQNKKESE